MPTKQEFIDAIRRKLRDAELQGEIYETINSGELHRELGGYPSPRHQMPSCWDAMHEVQQAGDVVMRAPPKGKGASLTIRYKLPR